MKILNLYAGIGGNRKLWGDQHKITAVEYDKDIAAIYKDFFPNDEVLVEDAHEYLINHYKDYDFIWSSPPCPTHSRINFLLNQKETFKLKYPDMKLYEEIILLDCFFEGKYVVENVKGWYKPLVEPQNMGRHYIWSNFKIPNIKIKSNSTGNNKGMTLQKKMQLKGYDIKEWHNYKGDKRTLINNCVEKQIGIEILNAIK